jgi:hypothetical protein
VPYTRPAPDLCTVHKLPKHESPSAAQALSVGREPTPRALTVGRLREPGPACGRSGRWHAIAARGEIAIRATAAPVRDRQRFTGGACDGGDQDRDGGDARHGAPRLPRLRSIPSDLRASVGLSCQFRLRGTPTRTESVNRLASCSELSLTCAKSSLHGRAPSRLPTTLHRPCGTGR